MGCRKWRELSTTDLEACDKSRTVVVLPVGSTEQHGPHLPVGTDAMIVDAVVDALLARQPAAECLILPTLWCTRSNEHAAFAGTVSLTAETLIRVLSEIGASVARAGFRKVVFLNGHGGNTEVMGIVQRDVRQQTGLLTFGVELWRLYAPPPASEAESEPCDIHAGWYETSVMLDRYPDLLAGRRLQGLGSDRARGRIAASFAGFKYLRPEGTPVNVAWLTGDYSEDGVIGDPSIASAKAGHCEFEKLVDQVGEILAEVARFEYRD